MTRVLVIGGGIGGLATAFRLGEQARARGKSVAITVLEAGPGWGGVCRSEQVDGCLIEAGPDSIIRAKPAGVELCCDLGLENELIGTDPETRRALIAKGTRLVPVPRGVYLMAPANPLPFLFSPLMSWRGKLRVVAEMFVRRRPVDAPEESLAGFVRRRFGCEALDRLAQPMIGGIYTADPERLSLSATMPQFIEMEREHGSVIRALRARCARDGEDDASGARYGLFASLRGGLGRLVETLIERLHTDGYELRARSPVTTLRRDGAGWIADLADGSAIRADQVVLALPANAAAPLCRGIDAGLADELIGIAYAGVVTISIAVADDQVRLPQAAGFVVPALEGRTVIACTFASRKYAGRAPSGTTLLRAFVGGALHPETLALGDDELTRQVVADLRELIGLCDDPRWTRVHRWPASMAQFHLGHRQRLERIRARERSMPGLALVGNGYEGVGIPDIVAQAGAATHRLALGW